MSTPTQCFDIGSDGYVYPVYDMFALKNELRKLKGKNVVNTADSKSSATIAPGIFKLDIEPISHRLKNNRDSHEVYLEKTIENTDTLRGLVECARKQTDNGIEFVNQTLKAYYEEVRILHQTSVARTSQQNGVVKIRNRTLVETARTMLIFSKASLFLWAKVVATACYTQNRSLIRKRHNKIPYELLHDRKPTNPNFMSLVLSAIPLMTVKILYHNPPPCVDLQVPIVIAPKPAVSTGTPSSTTIDQDAPSTSTSQTILETPYPVIPLGVKEANHDIKVTHMDNNPYIDFPIPEPSSEESSTQVVIPDNVHSINQPPKHINKWTKDHSIDNVTGDPSRLISTRHQLQDEALLCYFNAFLSPVEPKSYKYALKESC
ncbi:retrovirus-related pol polyprotein from transposon TNT 1-94 [Tanacetum coccineum]